MPTYYLDYVNGNDANDGSDWANAWKTITLGATAARIAPGDIIRIAKSPAPSSIGNAEWTNLSKTVTLATAQTLTIDLCETAWTGAGDTTITRTAVATDAKEGSYCMKLAVDASPQANILQAYFATGTLDLSAYQKISFWIKNEAAIANATTWVVKLCSDTAGADAVDTFVIPAIPMVQARWIPLTLARVGNGNLGNAIKSIAIYSGATAPTASKYIYVDNFIACTTNGLSLQSLISKNSLEQGGIEGWYGIQSINGVTVLLDNDTNTKSNAGRGYSGIGETVTTYKRETIKTDLVGYTTAVQSIMDSGSLAVGNIQFQGGYNIATTEQDGETFFDGLNGGGYGIYAISKSYITLNYLNVIRYYIGIYLNGSSNNTITNLNNANNNNQYGIQFGAASNNIITTLGNANNNGLHGIYYYSNSNNNIITLLGNANNNNQYGVSHSNCNNNIITTLSNANNNGTGGIIYTAASNNNIITLLGNANNNGSYGVLCSASINNIIRSLSTTGNTTSGVFCDATSGPNYLNNALIAEGTEISFTPAAYSNLRVYSNNHDQDTAKHWIYTDGGTINSVATDREGGTGIMWKLSPTSTRTSFYPLILSVAKIACVADKLITVKIYMKKDHATNVAGILVCPGGQLTGMTVADIVATKTDVANTWEELTVTTTPTQLGVVEIEVWAYYVAGNANIYCEDMSISQAD